MVLSPGIRGDIPPQYIIGIQERLRKKGSLAGADEDARNITMELMFTEGAMVRHDYDHPTRSEAGGAKIEEVYGEAARDGKYYLRTAKTKGFCSSAKFTGLKTKEIGPGKPLFPRSKSLGRLRFKPGRRGSEVTKTEPNIKEDGYLPSRYCPGCNKKN